jgi:hypothetical protein
MVDGAGVGIIVAGNEVLEGVAKLFIDRVDSSTNLGT